MPRFLSDWVVARSRDGVNWDLEDPVTFIGKYGTYTVPAKYITDFATVPWLFRLFFPRSGPWNLAAVIHDWLISVGLQLGKINLTSAQVDEEFRVALEVCKVGVIRRWLMWAGVRWAAPGTKCRRSWGWFKTLPGLLGVTAVALAPVVAPLVFLLQR